MKCLVFACLLIGVVCAEPPRFRSARLRSKFFARQEAEAEATTPPVEQAPYPPAKAPYPPSGWRPAGQAFELPKAAELAPPENEYGAPANAYGAPVNAYGAPNELYGPPTTPPTADFTTVEPEAETVAPEGQSERFRLLKSQRQIAGNGQNSFYVLLPDGTLQQVGLISPGTRLNSRFPAKLLQEVQSSRLVAIGNRNRF